MPIPQHLLWKIKDGTLLKTFYEVRKVTLIPKPDKIVVKKPKNLQTNTSYDHGYKILNKILANQTYIKI